PAPRRGRPRVRRDDARQAGRRRSRAERRRCCAAGSRLMPAWLGDLGHWFVDSRGGSALLQVLIVGNIVPMLIACLVWLERRVAAWIQDRTGPNRVGPFGLLQSFADLLKFIFKEDVLPSHVDRAMYLLAPALAVMPPLVVISLLPFAER